MSVRVDVVSWSCKLGATLTRFKVAAITADTLLRLWLPCNCLLAIRYEMTYTVNVNCRYTAFAVNYFIGSGPFVRALRYWARTATKSLAQQVAPSANGFKLTDTVLAPLIVQPKQRLEKGQVKSVDVLVPPGVHCDDETQIFEALGLAYVPPYMRYFGSNYQ